MIDIFSLKVEEIASNIKDSQLTSVEICEKYIERINKYEKDVNAWAHLNKKLVLDQRDIQELFKKREIKTLRADWTNRDDAIFKSEQPPSKSPIDFFAENRIE